LLDEYGPNYVKGEEVLKQLESVEKDGLQSAGIGLWGMGY
jgi:hypothetical protein